METPLFVRDWKNQSSDAERIEDRTAGVTPAPTEPIWLSVNYRKFDSDSCSGIEIGGIGRNLGYFPHFLIGLPERPSEPSNSNRSQRGDDVLNGVKTFTNLNQDKWREIIAGALLVAGLGFRAYLARRA